MKKLLKILIVLVVIGAVIFTGAYIYVRNNGKKLLTEQLSQAIKTKVTMDDVRLRLPFNLCIKNLSVGGYGSVKMATVRLSWLQLFKKEIRLPFLMLEEPVITIKRTKNARITFGSIILASARNDSSGEQSIIENTVKTEKKVVDKAPGKNKVSKPALSFVVDRLIIKDGVVNFIDDFSEKLFKLTLADTELKIRRLAYPFKSIKTNYDVSASFKNPDSSSQPSWGKLKASGWVNLGKKDMQGKIKINELDSNLFSRYYTEDEGLGFKGIINLSANLTAKNNDMTVKGEMSVKSVAPEKKKDSDEFSIEDYILRGLQSINVEISTSFSFKTKLDNFKIDKLSFSGTIQQ